MSFAHLLTALTTAILGFVFPIIHGHQNIPTPPQVLASTTKKTVVTTISTISPTITFSIMPPSSKKQISLPVSTNPNSIVAKTLLIDCIGPDGKHMHITQKACDDFNNAWHHTTNNSPTSTYGQAKKVGDHTYELQVPPDARMANAQEVLAALNQYRQKNGVSTLGWSDALGSYAQSRANLFSGKGSLDEHAGFIDFIHNQDGFTKLGFNHLGENAAFAGPLSGTHLIEGIFAADAEHDGNQINTEWTKVGIGISGIATDVVFGGSPR